VKPFFKAAAETLATIFVLPAWLLLQIGSPLFGKTRVFAGWSQAWSLAPGLGGVYLRRSFYRLAGVSCPETHIEFGTLLSSPEVAFGRHCYLGAYCVLGRVTFGDDVIVGSHASFINGGRQHGSVDLRQPMNAQPGCFPALSVGRDSWIGERAVVMANVGNHCIVGAGAVVTKPVPDYAVVAGSPARILRYRDRPLTDSESAN